MARRKKNGKAFSPAKDRKYVLPIIDILLDGQPTIFCYEGACRHGLRASFVLQGDRWARADARSAVIVSAALKRLGAIRPDWAEGQPEWTDPGYAPGERYWCQHCGGEMPEDRGLGAKFCSKDCKIAHYNAGARRAGAQNSHATYLAMLAARKKQAIKRHGIECQNCGEKFLVIDKKRKIRSFKYCSQSCRDAACAPRPCVVCAKVFKPNRNADAKTCGQNSCLAELRRRRNRKAWGERECVTCGRTFQPNGNRRDQEFCSVACANQRWHGVPGGTLRAKANGKGNGKANGHNGSGDNLTPLEPHVRGHYDPGGGFSTNGGRHPNDEPR